MPWLKNSKMSRDITWDSISDHTLSQHYTLSPGAAVTGGLWPCNTSVLVKYPKHLWPGNRIPYTVLYCIQHVRREKIWVGHPKISQGIWVLGLWDVTLHKHFIVLHTASLNHCGNGLIYTIDRSTYLPLLVAHVSTAFILTSAAHFLLSKNTLTTFHEQYNSKSKIKKKVL